MSGGKTMTPYSTSVPRKCDEKCYQTRILPLLVKKHVSVFFYIYSNTALPNMFAYMLNLNCAQSHYIIDNSCYITR